MSREYNRRINAIREKDREEEAAVNDEKPGCATSATSHDSGVDVSASKTESTDLRKGGFQMDSIDVKQELHNWMLAPFADTFEELATPAHKIEKPTLQEWYNGPTHFFDIEPDENGELSNTELESASDLEERMQKLMPTIEIPKYIRELKIPRFDSTELKVVDEATNLDSYRPSIVEDKDGNVYFVKIVDKDQPQPTKRELKLLKRIEDIGLNKSINVPQVLGLVYPGPGSSRIMGFLQSNIKNPTPLTKMLDEDVSQRKRDKWAKEVGHMKEHLHENDIVFGDMKADNFLVDENDKLWIIDFGGSYTEGWVNPELAETEEGDDMGAEKIVNALHDPVNYTQDTQPDASPGQKGGEKRKRKEADIEEDAVGSEDVTKDVGVEKPKQGKRVKFDETTKSEKKYCICNGPDSGRMVACENEDCERQWFHFDCVGLKESPPTDTKWFCDDCKPKTKKMSGDSVKGEKYCFCGGPESGRMVACDNEECEKQWFHFDCVGLKESPPKGIKWFCDECKPEE
jgi:tRNA A-37 threonylcarbamoyl transferase component Bud32